MRIWLLTLRKQEFTETAVRVRGRSGHDPRRTALR